MPKTCPRYDQYLPMVCPRYVPDMPKICPRYAQDMSKICPSYAQDIPKIWPRYPIPISLHSHLIPINKGGLVGPALLGACLSLPSSSFLLRVWTFVKSIYCPFSSYLELCVSWTCSNKKPKASYIELAFCQVVVWTLYEPYEPLVRFIKCPSCLVYLGLNVVCMTYLRAARC